MRTVMEQTLSGLGAEALYICGLATFGCVNATVMCAICKDYKVTVVRDAHGARGFPDWPLSEVIDHYSGEWERAGARLVSARGVSF